MASSSVTPPFKPDTSDMNVESEESIMARESAQDIGDDQTLDRKTKKNGKSGTLFTTPRFRRRWSNIWSGRPKMAPET